MWNYYRDEVNDDVNENNDDDYRDYSEIEIAFNGDFNNAYILV